MANGKDTLRGTAVGNDLRSYLDRHALHAAMTVTSVLFLLTFFEYRSSAPTEPVESKIVAVSLNITTGHPEWKTFENRIAGPFLCRAVSHFSGLTYPNCHAVFMAGMLLLSNAIPLLILPRLFANPRDVFLFLLLNAMLIVAIQHCGFMYDWDLIDLSTMFLFAYAVFAGSPVWALTLLFVVELANRESALFIPLWIVIDAVVSMTRRFERRALAKAGLGVVLIAIGSMWTAFLRGRLLLADPHDERVRQVVMGQHLQIRQNLYDLAHPFAPDGFDSSRGLAAYVLLATFGLLFVFFARCPVVPRTQVVKVGVLLLAMMMSLFLFGLLMESRVWFELVPFMLFLYFMPWARMRHGISPPPQPGRRGVIEVTHG